MNELAKGCTLIGKLSAVPLYRSPACGCNHAMLSNVFADVGQGPLCDMVRALDVYDGSWALMLRTVLHHDEV